jgi:hypothetical protein
MLPLWTMLKHLWNHRRWMDYSAPIKTRKCTLCNTYLLTGTDKPFYTEI